MYVIYPASVYNDDTTHTYCNIECSVTHTTANSNG